MVHNRNSNRASADAPGRTGNKRSDGAGGARRRSDSARGSDPRGESRWGEQRGGGEARRNSRGGGERQRDSYSGDGRRRDNRADDRRRQNRGGADRRESGERRGEKRSGEKRWGDAHKTGERRGGDRRGAERQWSERRDDRRRDDRRRDERHGEKRHGEEQYRDRRHRDSRDTGDNRRGGGHKPRDNRRNDARPENHRNGFQNGGRGGLRGADRSDRGGREREFTDAERLAHSLRPVRAKHTDPEIPDEVTVKQLPPAVRNELKTLEKENAETVGRHLAMAGLLIDTDPHLAHAHAMSAARRAGRIPVARETLAVTAYALGDYAMTLRELRTYRRLSGKQNYIGLMVDSERGLNRPEKALEVAREVDPATLDTESRVHLAIAVSGARLDLGQPQQALAELEIPELNTTKVFSWSPELFTAYATVLAETGDADGAEKWRSYANRAAQALIDHAGGDQLEVIETVASDAELEESGVLAQLREEAAAAHRTDSDDSDAAHTAEQDSTTVTATQDTIPDTEQPENTEPVDSETPEERQ